MVNMPLATMAIIEARKDGFVPRTVEKLEWVAINGAVIVEYVDHRFSRSFNRHRNIRFLPKVHPNLSVYFIPSSHESD